MSQKNKMNKEIPGVASSDIDYRLFPKLYKNVDDILQFISEHGVVAPVTVNLLNLNKLNKLGLTPTESKFYFEVLFDDIYDVCRIPIECTYIQAQKMIEEHIELVLVQGGLDAVKRDVFDSIRQYDTDKEVNYFTYIGCEEDKYYAKNPICLEQFWIRTSLTGIQPIVMDDGEAYARVWVCTDYVHIFGCDDCLYTLTTNDAEISRDFARYLKCAVPVWNFSFPKKIHEELEFLQINAIRCRTYKIK